MLLTNHSAFFVVHRLDHAGDLSGDGIGIKRGDGADGFEINADVSLCRGRGSYGDRPGEGGTTASGGGGCLTALTPAMAADHPINQQRCEDRDQNPDPGLCSFWRLASLSRRQAVVRRNVTDGFWLAHDDRAMRWRLGHEHIEILLGLLG